MFDLVKKTSYLPTLYAKILKNKKFFMKLLAFLKYIIKYSAKYNAFFDILHHVYLTTHKVNIIKNFTAQLKKKSKAIAKKVLINFLIYNPTYYNITQVNPKYASLISQDLKFWLLI